jgi:hypothetical protein
MIPHRVPVVIYTTRPEPSPMSSPFPDLHSALRASIQKAHSLFPRMEAMAFLSKSGSVQVSQTIRDFEPPSGDSTSGPIAWDRTPLYTLLTRNQTIMVMRGLQVRK